MNVTIDNQQVTTVKIAWLAGIWDGEGTLSIVKQNKRLRKGHGEGNQGLNPKATMENTSILIIEECCKILDSLDIKYYISERKAKSNKHKDRYVVQICRLDMIVKFCDALIPYLISKRSQAYLLKKYAESRFKGGRKSYSISEFDYCDQIQGLNKLGPVGTSTTLRETLTSQIINKKRRINESDVKIKSDLHGDMQLTKNANISNK